MPGIVQVFLGVLVIGIVAMASGYAVCTNADETPTSIIGGLIAVIGAVAFLVGIVGAPLTYGAHQSQEREIKLKNVVAGKLIDSGNTHVEFHKLDGALVASYLNSDNISCGVVAENLQYHKCVNEPNGPIYTKALQKLLEDLITAPMNP